ncbi:hypothetical protein AB0M44_36360 [Streptosporangium subroseum]|uniref:hypothetical protein n=1 Tax=Streptosporangium subroseum TaxID=106412 RepID=UPI00342E2126
MERQRARAQEAETALAALAAVRVEALIEAADVAETVAIRLHQESEVTSSNGAYDVMTELRRMATASAPVRECPQCGDSGACNGGPCPLAPAREQGHRSSPSHFLSVCDRWARV